MDMRSLINQCTGCPIMVVGDFMLDIYHKGDSFRIAPEAPVPVVDIQDRQFYPGGAANVAFNLRALGAKPLLCSVTGADEAGKRGRQLLSANDTSISFMVSSPNVKTLVKERIMARDQTLVRFDSGTCGQLDPATENELIKKIKQAYSHCEAVILSDYNKGIFTDNIIAVLIELRHKKPVYLAIDSGRLPRFRSLRPDVVTPNYQEALQLLQTAPAVQKDRWRTLADYGNTFTKQTGAVVVAVTIDEEGVILFKDQKFAGHIPAKKVKDPQVAGAGDTFISAFTLMQTAGGSLQTATEAAVAAAGITIQKPGTACCMENELRFHFAYQTKHITSHEEIAALCDLYHAKGKSIVFTNGCFDILHSGHVNYLKRAAALGDIMIIGLNTDESIHRLKGEDRPINPLSDRIEVLSALETVNHIITFGRQGDDTPAALIKAICPDIYVKGGDYTKSDLPEAALVESQGGIVRILSHVPDHSTTGVIKHIQQLSTVLH